MRYPCPIPAVGVLALSLPAPGLSAQALDRSNAVDPNVGDRGPNAASLRYVEPGNAQHSFAARLTTTDFRTGWSAHSAANPIATDPATGLPHSQGFQYTAPGVRALIDRPDYLVDLGGPVPGRNIQPIRDGAQSLIIPANTVFQLTLDRPRVEPPAPEPAAGNFVDLRVSPHPVRSVPMQNPVSFSVEGAGGQSGNTFEIDASQLRFPAAALAGQSRDTTPASNPPPADSEAAETSSSQDTAEAPAADTTENRDNQPE